MGRALKYLLRLALLAVLGLAAYALLADLPPPTRTVEVELAVPPAGAPAEAAGGQDDGAEAEPPESGPAEPGPAEPEPAEPGAAAE